ncbi:MAG TPA: hypothetical protein VGY48_14240 [Vicinamibacterales bacterium]|nr:hypothetical protein [Vicinamibacterales bacterium]
MSETVLILAGGTAVLALMFGIRVAMRVAAPRPDGSKVPAEGRAGAPDVAGVIALPPLIVFLGLGVAAGSVWAIGLVVPLVWVINTGVIAREERYLERKFGDAYRAYKARVRRWV